MATQQDIVDLRIEAENLASPQLIKAAEDVEGLGRKAEQAQREVKQLEVTQETINSFNQAGDRIDGLQNEVAQATTEFKKLSVELKKTENATDEQSNAVVKQQQTVKKLTADLRGAEREYRNIDASLRQAGVNTKQFTSEQERLNTELVQARVESNKLNDTYDKQVDKIREKITEQKKSVAATKAEAEAQEKLSSELEQQANARKKSVDAAKAQLASDKQLAASVKKYEAALEKLNAEKIAGNITTGKYIRAEANLRRQMKLTSTQVSTSRRAIEADAVTKTKAARSTDALTTVTRRLAQAYTVLIAAQGAASAAIGNVQAYGALESSLIGIERTTGLAADEVTNLGKQIVELSKDVTPTATSELLGFAEVAGQLGVKGSADILNIVNAADQLGVSTNIAGGEAATLLTRILETTGEGIPKIGNLASSVVELGNNFALTETEVVKFGKEIVTATRDIGLSSAASLALGSTLALAGQRAEASRTAVSRLSQAIRRAATEGGDDLESLAKITNLTGEEIRESLGKDSEKVILGFVEGLSKIQKQGGVTLDTLRQFGIDGQEAAGVFNGLTARVSTLAEALNQSNEAYIAGNSQIKEAAKAYASQEAAIGRLTNTFTALRQNIGQAFSDETDGLIKRFTGNLNDSEQELINLFEILPDVITGLDELVSSFGNVSGAFSGGGALAGAAEGFVVFGNGLTSGINTIILAFQSLTLEVASAISDISVIMGGTANTQFIDSLKSAIAETKSDIARDGKDIQESIKRLSGDSSRLYRDLIEVSDKYKDSLSGLTAEQQGQLSSILESNKYNAASNGIYRELTAAIVSANRRREIEGELLVKNNKLQKDAVDAAEAENAAKASGADATERKNLALTTESELTKFLVEDTAKLSEQYKNNVINAEQLVNGMAALNENYKVQKQEIIDTVNQRKVESNVIQDTIRSMDALVIQYQNGSISTEQYNLRQTELTTTLNNAHIALSNSSKSSYELSAAQLKLNVEIDKSARAIEDLQIQLRSKTLAENESRETTAKLSAEQEKYNLLVAEQARLDEINNASFFELQRQRVLTTQQLSDVTVEFEAGSISVGEYTARKEELLKTLSKLNSVLGSTSDALVDNTKSQEKATEATTKSYVAQKQAGASANLLAQEYQYLNREFDFTSSTATELSERLVTLDAGIVKNMSVTSSWWRELAQVSAQGFIREKQIINETLLLRKYTAQVESGNLTLGELNAISKSANLNINQLGDNQLDPLRNAIRDAKRQFQDLNATIDDALNDTLDRLDEISGNQADIVKRRYEQERIQYEELLSLAQQSGDAAAISRARQVIQQLEKAQKLEFNQQFGNNNNNSNNVNSGGNIPTQTQTFSVNLRLPDGGSTNINVASQSDVSALLETFESFGEVSTGGDS